MTRTSRYCLLTILMAVLAVAAKAQGINRLILPDVAVQTGPSQIPVSIENDDPIVAAQFDLTLPAGVTAGQTAAMTSRSDGHVMAVRPLDGSRYRVMLYSAENRPLLGQSGVVAYIPIVVPSSVEEGSEHQLVVTDAVLSDLSADNVLTESVAGQLRVSRLPDLVVRNVAVNSLTVTPGEPFAASWEVENVGELGTAGGWSEQLSLVSADGKTVRPLATVYYGDSLAAKAAISRKATVTVPMFLGIDGPAHLQVRVVPGEKAGESPSAQANNTLLGEEVLTVEKRLTLSFSPVRIIENETPRIAATLNRSGLWTEAQAFPMTATADSRLSVPSEMVIPAGQSGIVFYMQVSDNSLLDTDSVVTVTVAGHGYDPVSASVTIEDDEHPSLTLAASATDLNEGDTFQLTVTLSRASDTPVTVQLACEDGKRFDFPSSLTVLAGETSVWTDVKVIDDDEIHQSISTAFYVSAEGFDSGEAILTIKDNDMPDIEMLFAPSSVLANAGSNAVIGTVRRLNHLNSRMTVVLSDDAGGLLSFSNRKLILERGVSEVRFNVSTNGFIDNDREVSITATIYASNCDCPVNSQEGGHVSQLLKVLVGEGMAISLEPSSTAFSPGTDNSITVTIDHPLDRDATITVTSDHDEWLVYEHTVLIAAGETSATIPVTYNDDAAVTEGQAITFTAAAEGYVPGVCWAIEDGRGLPDAVIASLVANATEAEAESKVELTAIVKNVGNDYLDENTIVSISLSSDSYPVKMRIGKSLAKGDTAVVRTNYILPQKTGTYYFQAVVNPNGSVEEVLTTNNASQQIPIVVKPNFQVTAKTDKTTYGQGEIITVTGQATGTKSAYANVEVYFINNGIRQAVSAKTDAEGYYTAVFLPLEGTSGHFAIGACYPGEGSTEAMAEVDTYGLTMNSYNTICRIGYGETYQGSIIVNNPGIQPQTGVRIEQQESAVGCEFSFPVIERIEAGGSKEIHYTIKATDNCTSGKQRMMVAVVTNEGAMVTHQINYTIESAKGCLKTDSTTVRMKMTQGVNRDFPLIVWNTGMASTGEITLTLPSWVESLTPTRLPSLAPGDTLTTILRVVPTDKMCLNVPINGRIGMNCTEGAGLSIALEVTPVSDQTGTVTIDVTDEYTYLSEEQPHVRGAQVQVYNRATLAVVAEGLTNDEGLFVATIPEGWYRLRVKAENHESYDEDLLVDPAMSKRKNVFLSFSGIDMGWKVEETEVKDEYSIETTVTFETRVPPPYVRVIWPKERPQLDKYYPITLVNEGLIHVTGVKARLGISANDFDMEIIGNLDIDTLAAKQSVVLYAKFTPKNQSRNVRKSSLVFKGDCFSIFANTEYGYECGEYVQKTVYSTKRWGDCGGGYTPHDNPGGDGGGGYIPDEPQEIACDLPKFKIVAAEDYTQNARGRAQGLNANSKKEEKIMRGVVTDGVSKVKIVLAEEYDTGNITDVTWKINEAGCGSLSNVHSLEGAEYTSPAMFPPSTGPIEYSHKITFSLHCKQDGKEKTIPDAASVELIRVPVIMVHGLNSDPYSCWHTVSGDRGLYEYLQTHGYSQNNLFTVDYRDTHNQSFQTNKDVVGNTIEDRIEYLYDKAIQCSSVDVVAHSMGGLLTKLYIQNNPKKEKLFHKVITINSPHGGSQLGNFMNDPVVQFVRDINEGASWWELLDPIDLVTTDYSLGRKVLNILYDVFSPWKTISEEGNIIIREKDDISKGAVHDLRVEGEEIGNINNNKTNGVKCHAIVTSAKTNLLNNLNKKFVWGIKIANLLSIPKCLGYDTAEALIKDVYNGVESDLIVPTPSQKGGLSDNHISFLPVTHPGNWNYMHTESCHNENVQSEVLNLLRQDKRSTSFSNGFKTTTDNSLKYVTDDNMSWEKILKRYPYKAISNGEELFYKYFDESPLLFNSWKNGELSPNNARKTGFGKIASTSSLMFTHELAEGDTLMNIKVTPNGDFTEVSFGCFFNDNPFAYVDSTEGQVRLPDKVQGKIVVVCEGRRDDGAWCIKSDIIPINTIGNTTMQNLSFAQDSLLIINNEYLSPTVLCTWSDGTVTEVETPTLSVTNENLAYIEDNKYVYGKNSGHTNIVASYGGLTCSTPLEVYFTGDDIYLEDDDEDEGSSGSVCSTVTLSFKQKAVMTRQAFRGTLTLNNNHPSMPLENLKIQLEVRDEDGKIATQHEFQINPESLNGDFEGQLDFESGWSLKSKGTGVATILFIPTKYAAPTEPRQWSFGGTISYTDPFTGLTIKHSLNPVTLTVKPSPVLDLTFFMQRDIVGDDPLTEKTEPMVPAEFALLVNNKGHGDVENFRFTCKQPEITENEKGLLIDFKILSSQLNGESKTIALDEDIPVEFGTLPAQSQAYVQWWLQSSLLGHFIEYDVKATHDTSYGNKDLSLLDQVTIHELIHGFTPSQLQAPARAFLVNDEPDSNDRPDKVFFSNATQVTVSMASSVNVSRQSNNEYLLTVMPTKQGWSYGQLNDPTRGRMQVAKIVRQSDGTELPVDNVWQTDRTLRDGKDWLYENRLHFIGDIPEGGEQFLITFEDKPDFRLEVEAIEGVPAEETVYDGAVKEVTVCFNKPINEETFTVDDIALFHEGTSVNVSEANISKTDEQTFIVNLGAAVLPNGYYVLMVKTEAIVDSDGFEGENSYDVSWRQTGENDPNAPIPFADAEVKRICVENWDTNGDGELSYAEAAEVSDLGDVFSKNSAITNFDELAFFTSLTNIADQTFYRCRSLHSVALPESLRTIGYRAFMECKLQSLTIPDGVQVIQGAAFADNDIRSVRIPASVGYIGNYVFAGNRQLATIVVDPENTVYDSRNGCNAIINTSSNELIQGSMNTVIPAGIVGLADGAFEFVEIETLILPQGLERIGMNVFWGCRKLKEIALPEGLISIGRYSFTNCVSLKEFHIPQSVSFVDGSAIAGCDEITAISVADGNANYCSVEGSNAVTNKDGTVLVMGCSTTVIPSTVRVIANECFRERRKLLSIEIPEGVESIEEYAFCECSALGSIVIPKNVAAIGDYAFSSCTRLRTVTVMRPNPISITNNVFSYQDESILYVPFGCKTAYETAEYWKDFKEIVEMPVIATVTLDLAKGWNWVSSCLQEPLSLESFSEFCSRIVGQTQELIRDPSLGMTGGLTVLEVDKGYKVLADEEKSLTVTGVVRAIDGATIDVRQGWNWVGYPYPQMGDVAVITNAEEGDFIVSQKEFTEYTDGEWTGSLTVLSPGEGYLYKSVGNKALKYAPMATDSRLFHSTQRRDAKLSSAERHCEELSHAYPSTMSITARLCHDGQPVEWGDNPPRLYAIADGELRGIGVVVGDFYCLTVYGDRPVEINFVVEDAVHGEQTTAMESLSFRDDVVGSRRQPFVINVGSPTGIREQTQGSHCHGIVYDMQGRKVNGRRTAVNSRLRKGVYIYEGRKVVK